MKFLFKSKLNKVLLLAFAIGISGGTLSAQDFMQQPQQQVEYSDKQIDDFVGAVAKVLPVQQEVEQKMIKEIENNGMDLNQFNQIATQLQTSGNAEGVAEADVKKFEKVSEEVQKIQMENQEQINKVIADAGLTPEIYQEMVQAYSRDPQLKEKVDAKLNQEQ
jgi:hypothetical protein